MSRKKKKDMYYLKNEVFLPIIMECKERDELTPEALEAFYMIGENFIRTYKYFGLDPEKDKEDCLSYGIQAMITGWRGFDPTKGKKPNPFSYFTQIFKNGMFKGFNDLYPYNKHEDAKPPIRLSLLSDSCGLLGE